MSYTTKLYRDRGGDRLVVEPGGIVQLKTGGLIVGDAGSQVSAIADLAGAVGTANDTMTAVPAPTDTPADADALRDDIAANVVPAINDNLADLQAKVNGMLAALRDRGGSRGICFRAVSAGMFNGQVHRVLRALCSQLPFPSVTVVRVVWRRW